MRDDFVPWLSDALDIVNAKRAENGLAALNWSNGLESCAMVRAQEAASKFSHTRPNGKDWYTVNSELMWGENLAKGYDSAQSVVDAWMASPTHAANILAGDLPPAALRSMRPMASCILPRSSAINRVFLIMRDREINDRRELNILNGILNSLFGLQKIENFPESW